MKKHSLSFLLSLLVILLSFSANAQSTLVHYWHFNNFASSEYTDTIHGIPADYSRTANQAVLLYDTVSGTSPVYSTYIDTLTAISTDYDTVNLRMSAVPGIMIRARNPSDSMQMLFYIPTTNYKNIVFTYGTESSSASHGQLHQNFDYSTDSGTTWKTSGLSMTTDSAALSFNRISVNFLGDTLANNNSKLFFRIKFQGNTTGTSGNNRFDNISVDADTITAGPSAVLNVVAAHTQYILYPNPVTNNINVTSGSEGTKTILITNTLGETVYMGIRDGKAFSLSAANLAAGNYFMTIRDNSGMRTTMFVKH